MVIKNLKTHYPQLPTFKSLKPGDVFVVDVDAAVYKKEAHIEIVD
jgi:hypothetical protein